MTAAFLGLFLRRVFMDYPLLLQATGGQEQGNALCFAYLSNDIKYLSHYA